MQHRKTSHPTFFRIIFIKNDPESAHLRQANLNGTVYNAPDDVKIQTEAFSSVQ